MRYEHFLSRIKKMKYEKEGEKERRKWEDIYKNTVFNPILDDRFCTKNMLCAEKTWQKKIALVLPYTNFLECS